MVTGWLQWGGVCAWWQKAGVTPSDSTVRSGHALVFSISLAFPLNKSYRQGVYKGLFQRLWFGRPCSWGSSGRPPLQIPRPTIPTGTWVLSSIMPNFFSLRGLVTMDTVKEVPLPIKADGWHSGNEQMNEREGTDDLGSSPCALSYLQKGFEGDVFLWGGRMKLRGWGLWLWSHMGLHLNPSPTTD